MTDKIIVVIPSGETLEFPDETQATCFADISGGMWKAVRSVTMPQGTRSMRASNLYAVKEYRLVRLKSGKIVWKADTTLASKITALELYNAGYGRLRYGSLHNKPAAEVFD